MKFSIRAFAAAFSTLALMHSVAGPAQAQIARTFVSGVGNDANPCTRTAPCQTFAVAFAKTALNGEINCLDAGVFGGVTITQSVTIDCHDVFASILHGAGIGIGIAFDNFVTAGETHKTVRLRNINFNGSATQDGSSGIAGIRIIGANTAVSTVIIEDCVIDGNFNGVSRGIDDTRIGGGKLIVTNTTIRNNGGAGVSVLPFSGSTNIQVLLDNVRSHHNGTGAQFGPGVRGMIDQSAFDSNVGSGVLTVSGAIVQVDRSTMSHNANGVQTAGGGVIAISNSNISFNTSQGVNVSGGTVASFGNNRITFNASPGTLPGPAGSASSDLGQQ